jgi:hypothetical protein
MAGRITPHRAAVIMGWRKRPSPPRPRHQAPSQTHARRTRRAQPRDRRCRVRFRENHVRMPIGFDALDHEDMPVLVPSPDLPMWQIIYPIRSATELYCGKRTCRHASAPTKLINRGTARGTRTSWRALRTRSSRSKAFGLWAEIDVAGGPVKPGEFTARFILTVRRLRVCGLGS